jgi:hypothetical protein
MPEPTWEEWVAKFNSPQPGAATGAPLAAGPGTDVLSGANRANIAQLFDPRFGRDETINRGAENQIAGGWGEGGFGLNQTNRLLDSERKANFELGAKLLEPYLGREHESSINATNNAARLQQIAAEGAQALQRLQLSEAGQTARLNRSEAAALERAVLAGNQALQQITLREAGETGRERSRVQGNLANTLLSAALSGAGGSGGGGTRGRATGLAGSPITALGDYSSPRFGDMTTSYGSGNSIAGYRPPQDVINAATRARDDGGSILGLGSSSIDALLRKYGLL